MERNVALTAAENEDYAATRSALRLPIVALRERFPEIADDLDGALRAIFKAGWYRGFMRGGEILPR
jgi:hypothetical protein